MIVFHVFVFFVCFVAVYDEAVAIHVRRIIRQKKHDSHGRRWHKSSEWQKNEWSESSQRHGNGMRSEHKCCYRGCKSMLMFYMDGRRCHRHHSFYSNARIYANAQLKKKIKSTKVARTLYSYMAGKKEKQLEDSNKAITSTAKSKSKQITRQDTWHNYMTIKCNT